MASKISTTKDVDDQIDESVVDWFDSRGEFYIVDTGRGRWDTNRVKDHVQDKVHELSYDEMVGMEEQVGDRSPRRPQTSAWKDWLRGVRVTVKPATDIEREGDTGWVVEIDADSYRFASATRVAAAHHQKTAGEVRFIKDRGGDKSEWGWNSPGPSEREINEEFVFQPKYLKPLAEVLRSMLMALGHATSAHSKLVKVKSRTISPDGNLGGRGYIQKVSDMRRQLMNAIEVLSASSDTLYDELNAPHWNPAEDTLDPRDRQEVKEIVEDVETIKDDPEGWAEGQEDAIDENDDPLAVGKTASNLAIKWSLRSGDPEALQSYLQKVSQKLSLAQQYMRRMSELENDPSLASHPRQLKKFKVAAERLVSDLSSIRSSLDFVENNNG
jgi:hypothetical protein